MGHRPDEYPTYETPELSQEERYKAAERRSYCVECYRTDKTDMKDVEPAQMTLADLEEDSDETD